MDIVNNCGQYFDVKPPSSLCSLVVSEGLRKSSPNVTIFFANFSLSSIAYVYLLVKFLFCQFFYFFPVYLLPVIVNKVYIGCYSKIWPYTSGKTDIGSLWKFYHLWTKKSPLKFGDHSDPNPEPGLGLQIRTRFALAEVLGLRALWLLSGFH